MSLSSGGDYSKSLVPRDTRSLFTRRRGAKSSDYRRALYNGDLTRPSARFECVTHSTRGALSGARTNPNDPFLPARPGAEIV